MLLISFKRPSREERRAKWKKIGTPAGITVRLERVWRAQSHRLVFEFQATPKGKALVESVVRASAPVRNLLELLRSAIASELAVGPETRKALGNPANKRALRAFFGAQVKYYEGLVAFAKRKKGVFASTREAFEMLLRAERGNLSEVKALLERF